MKCNACWRELEGQAVSTTCGHLLCIEDARKIISSDGTCPICEQALSRSHVNPLDVNPNDEWVYRAMAGVSPGLLLKSAFNGVMFYIGQKELEMRYNIRRVAAHYQEQIKAMQEKYREEKVEDSTALQKMAKKCEMMQQEIESLRKDKEELQEKFSEKSRQKRKLDEMYDQLRSEYESMKRSAIKPANSFFSRNERGLFSNPTFDMLDDGDPIRKERLVFSPATPGRGEDIWPARQKNSSSPFEISSSSPAKQAPTTTAVGGTGRAGAHSVLGGGLSKPSTSLRNLILSPLKRPPISRSRPHMFPF